MNVVLALALTVVLLAANAFFVAAEFAVTSSRRAAIEPLAQEGRRGAKQALFALEHVSTMLATCQLGITVMSTSLGVLAEPAISAMVAPPLARLGVSPAVSHAVGFVVALAVVLFLHVVFGEMVPKNLSIAQSERALLALAPILTWMGRALGPVVGALDVTANGFLRLFGVEPGREIAATFTADEVASIVELSREEGKLVDDLGLLSGTLEFNEETVASVFVPLRDLHTVSPDVTPAEVEALVAKTGYSRFPVVDETGTLAGYVHLKDVLYATGSQRNEPIEPWRIRELEVVATTLDDQSALRAMQDGATHMIAVAPVSGASLVDAVGVLFMEDLLEELVGQVRDALQRANPGDAR